jgi:predicted MPP superfamily phosphohydrolase
MTRGVPRETAEEPLHAPLAGPAEARPVLRRLFDPAAGWFRRIERESSQWLSREFYPSVPGIGTLYAGIVNRQLTVCEGDIALARLPAAFEGTRVLLVSDLHVGPFFSGAALRKAFDRLALLEPDLILIAGDLTTSRVEEFMSCAGAFRSLRAPLGVFAVMGNHDHYTGDVERLRAMVEATGVGVLHNRSVLLEKEGSFLPLAGVDDLIEGEPDLDAALAGIPDPAASPVMLLSHNPDIFFEAERRGVSLVLSGHTHGGQVRMPGWPVIVRQSRYRLDEGSYRFGGAQIVVSRGLGVTGIPLRVACAPEAALLTLRRA